MMIKTIKASQVREQFLVASPQDVTRFVPCQGVKKLKSGRLLFKTSEGSISLKPSQKVSILSRRLRPSDSESLKNVLLFIETDGTDEALRKKALSGIALTVTELSDNVAGNALLRLSRRLHKAESRDDVESFALRLEHWFRAYGYLLREWGHSLHMDDMGNFWKYRSKPFSGDRGKEKVGTKTRAKCDSCGAPLVRIGAGRKNGWGLYRCEHCGNEYQIKET